MFFDIRDYRLCDQLIVELRYDGYNNEPSNNSFLADILRDIAESIERGNKNGQISYEEDDDTLVVDWERRNYSDGRRPIPNMDGLIQEE